MSTSFFSDLDSIAGGEEELGSSDKKGSDFFSDLPEEISRKRSLFSALPKGLIKGAASFSPIPSFGPVSQKQGLKLTEEFLPTYERGPEEILEFAGEAIPSLLGGEGSLIKKGLQSASSGLLKAGAKESGMPEWAQEIASAVGVLGPDVTKAITSKALKPSMKQKAVFDFLKEKGLSDTEITPIIQDKKKLSLLSKGALKYEKKDPWLRGIKQKLGSVFEDVRERGKEAGYLEGGNLSHFETEFNNKLHKVPRMYRGLIKKEVDDLFQNPIDFTELHDFDKAINAIVGGVEGGKAAIGILKEPIKNAQKSMNPALYKELQLANESYAKLAGFTEKMTKQNWEGLLKLGQAGKALMGVLTLNPAMIAGGAKVAASSAAARYGLKKALTSPRLQNIHGKIWEAVLKNKFPLALKLSNLFLTEAEED